MDRNTINYKHFQIYKKYIQTTNVSYLKETIQSYILESIHNDKQSLVKMPTKVNILNTVQPSAD